MIISKEGKENLKNYKYSCVDDSPFGKYVVHPFWNWVVKFYPRWWAPNALTLAGFLLTVIHYACLSHYNPTFLESPSTTPMWVNVLVGVLIFTAHTLDGTDGKQARRTNSSSALGEIFDHGCDAWVACFLPGAFFSLFGYGLTPMLMFHVQCFATFGFVLSHWEKYITGVLILPWLFDIIQVLSAVTFIFFGFVPVESTVPVWLVKYIVHGCAVIFWVVYLPFVLVRVLLLTKKRTDFKISMLITPLFDTILVLLSAYFWAKFSPNKVLNVHPRLFLYIFGTVCSNLAVRVMIAELGGMSMNLLTPLAKFYILLGQGSVFVHAQGVFPVSLRLELACMLLAAIVITVSHVIYSMQLVMEICAVLEIKAFTISRKN